MEQKQTLKLRIEKIKKTEKELRQRRQDLNENEVFLEKGDFKNGHLTVSGYNKIKEESEFVNAKYEIKIKIPKGLKNGFTEALENMATRELEHVRKEHTRVLMIILVSFFFGILIFTLRQLFMDITTLREFALVATWVFFWTAIEKFFFDLYKLQGKKRKIYHILMSNVTEY